jgi:hypothetical protein
VQLLSGEESGASDALWSAAMAVVESSEEQGKSLRKLLEDALWTTEFKVFGNSMGLGNIPDGLFAVAGGLYAIAEAIRGDARPESHVYHHRAPRPEPEGDTGPEVVKVDKRRAA